MREDWPSRSELAEELAWAEYLRTYVEREMRYLAWCREARLDPDASATAIEYEEEWSGAQAEDRRV